MNMMSNALGQIIGLVQQSWTWFFNLLNAMGGLGWFITAFMTLFTINKFTDLVLMQFLYSPTNSGIGQVEARGHAVERKLSR